MQIESYNSSEHMADVLNFDISLDNTAPQSESHSNESTKFKPKKGKGKKNNSNGVIVNNNRMESPYLEELMNRSHPWAVKTSTSHHQREYSLVSPWPIGSPIST